MGVRSLIPYQFLHRHFFLQGYAPPPPSAPAPPPPPGEGPPPPPSGTPAGDVAAQYAAAGPPAPSDTEAYAAYW